MITLLRILTTAVLLLAMFHVVLGVAADAPTETARLWFIGSGAAIAIYAIFVFGALDRVENQHVVGTSWVFGSAAIIAFVSYACWVLPEPQNFLLLAILIALNLVALFALATRLRRSEVVWCCSAGRDS